VLQFSAGRRSSGSVGGALPAVGDVQCSEVALTDAAVVKLAQGCARLKEVWIACSKVGDVALFALAVCAKSLRALQIQRCPKTTHVGVRTVAEHCTFECRACSVIFYSASLAACTIFVNYEDQLRHCHYSPQLLVLMITEHQ
jgi:hypothetical protein